MLLIDTTSIIFRGIRPLQKFGVTARNISFHNPFADMFLIQSIPDKLSVVPPDPWPGDSDLGREIISGTFKFAGQTIQKDKLSWEPAQASEEWFTELHSFEWLRDLRSAGGERARRMAREMVESWLDEYSKYDEKTWRADILGRRLKSWISFYDLFCSTATEEFKKSYFTGVVRQARYLSNALDMPDALSGIPLMQALRGLAYAGIALPGHEAYLERAFNDILDQIKEQILPDGGHISRNPEASFEFLLCLVDLRSALIAARIEIPEELQHAIDRIAPAVKFFRHQDSAFAQFNGGREKHAYLCETILMHSGANGKAMKSLPHSGYERLNKGRSSLIMDIGLPLLSKYSQKIHAGLFSFEYSYGRERIIVNCGTSETKGKWRELLRSTLAHSTLTVNNKNLIQFDKEGLASNLPIVTHRRFEEGDVLAVEAAHSAYMTDFGLNHHRAVKLVEKGDVLKGEDQLSGKSGQNFSIRFHLHPDIKATMLKEGEEVQVVAKSGASWIFKFRGHNAILEESVYCNNGIVPIKTQQIVFEGKTVSTTTVISWEMRKYKD